MSGKTILITGGSGFLGALTARHILRQTPGQKILLTDIVGHPRTRPLAGKAAFVSADLSDPRACLDLLPPDISALYHFASLVSGGAERDFIMGDVMGDVARISRLFCSAVVPGLDPPL
jgi:nucleoside-diphosphate-sugar epimerase